MLDQDFGQPLSIEVHELVARRRDPGRQVGQALGAHLAQRLVDPRRAVGELEGWEGPLAVGVRARVAHVAADRDAGQERRDRRALGLVLEIGRVDEARLAAELREVMEHEDPAAAAVAAHLEAGPVAGERIRANRPGGELLRRRDVRIVLAVVEHDLEQPGIGLERRAIAVLDPLDMTIGKDGGRLQPMPLFRGRSAHPGEIFLLVLVDDQVAAVVLARLDQPAEDAGRIVRIGDPRAGAAAVIGGEVVPGDRAPVGDAGGRLGPALDPREQPLGPRPVALDEVAPRGQRARLLVAGTAGQHRHQVLGARQDEGVAVARMRCVLVPGQPLVGLARDGRESQPDAPAERAIARAGVIRELELRRGAPSARRDPQRDAERAGPGRRARRELLADAAKGAATPRGRDRRQRARRRRRGRRGSRPRVPLERTAGAPIGRAPARAPWLLRWDISATQRIILCLGARSPKHDGRRARGLPRSSGPITELAASCYAR